MRTSVNQMTNLLRNLLIKRLRLKDPWKKLMEVGGQNEREQRPKKQKDVRLEGTTEENHPEGKSIFNTK